MDSMRRGEVGPKHPADLVVHECVLMVVVYLLGRETRLGDGLHFSDAGNGPQPVLVHT